MGSGTRIGQHPVDSNGLGEVFYIMLTEIFEFKIKPPLMGLPFKGRMREVMQQGGERVVANLQTLLEAEADASIAGTAQAAAPD